MPRYTSTDQIRRWRLHLEGLEEYFRKNPKVWDVLYRYLSSDERGEEEADATERSVCSRRLLDYLTTVYARKYSCRYMLTDSDGSQHVFDIYHGYQLALSGVHKRLMDPFNRSNPVYPNGGIVDFGLGEKRVQTSAAPLTFYRWAYENGVLEYAERNQRSIKDDMAKESKRKRGRVRKKIEDEPPSYNRPEKRPRRKRRCAAIDTTFHSDMTVRTNFT